MPPKGPGCSSVVRLEEQVRKDSVRAVGDEHETCTVLVILVAVGLVASACGSDEALTKAEFIEQGNAICTNTKAQLEPIFDEAFAIPDDATQQQEADALV